MTIDDKIRDKNPQYDIREAQQKYRHYHQVKLINIDILQVKKYYPLSKVECKIKQTLHICL